MTQRLRSDPVVGRIPFTVRAQSGVVLLGGTVGSTAARETAWRIVRDTDGVREVCTTVAVAESGTTPPSPFDDIAAGLLADDPALAAVPRAPRSTASWVTLAVVAAVAWGFVSLLLVTTPWMAVLVACAAVAVAVEVAHHPRRLGGRRGPRMMPAGHRSGHPTRTDETDGPLSGPGHHGKETK